MLPALPDPTGLVVAEAHRWCAQLVEWSEHAEDIEQVNEARAWANAVETYLAAKQAEGPAQTAARLLEARIGELLGPAEHYKGGPVGRDQPLDGRTRHDFRLMADRKDVWRHKLPLPRRRVLRLIRDDEADVRPNIEKPAQLMSDIYLGDFRQVLNDNYYESHVPNESIDLILTDPPYPAEHLPLWTDLAKFAKRVLSPSGLLAAMSGQTHLPEVYARLGEHLPYRWTMAYLMAGTANVVHARRVSTMWKPVLIYGSTQRRLHDVATSKAADKDYHGWGQSESGFYDLVRLLADPGDTVCDPFLGGGTTAIAARAHGCHFIGAENDPAAFATAEARLAA